MLFERMASSFSEDEEGQSMDSELEIILIKGRCCDQTEMAWNRLYFYDIQAVSLSDLNSTHFKDKTNSFSACAGCMTLHSLSYFAGNELHVIYVGFSWALDCNVPINSISRIKGCCQLEWEHHSKLACLRGASGHSGLWIAWIIQGNQGHSGLCIVLLGSSTWADSQQMADNIHRLSQKFHLV